MTLLLIVLLAVALPLGCLVRSKHLRHGPKWSTEWRQLGRNWATVGEVERSEWCHSLADYWALPWWQAVLVSQRPSLTPPPLRVKR